MARTLCIVLWISISSLGAPGDSRAAGDTVFDDRLSAILRGVLEEARETLGAASLSASLYISDRCFWEGSAGATRPDPGIRVDSDTIYAFGSITKTFVAGIVLQLAEEGKLSLDDPLGKWLPRYPGIDPDITVRRLLNHGSGLGGYMGSRPYRSAIKKDPDRVWRPEDILEYQVPPEDWYRGPPIYSNTNYILLGLIVEAISGHSLEQELEDRILGPLQLTGTFLPTRDFGSGRWADTSRLDRSRFSSVWAAGAIASVPKDIAKWSQRLYGGSFLQPASLEAMLVTEIRRIGRARFPMGLGVWKLEGEKFTAWGHGGRLPPYLSLAFYIPDLKLAVAHSFVAPGGGEQFLPGKRLTGAYIEHRPDDISKCFDS